MPATTVSWEEISTAPAVKLPVQLSTAVAPTLLSFQGVYSPRALIRQEQDTENWCPFPTVRASLRQRNCFKSCGTVPAFLVLRIEK